MGHTTVVFGEIDAGAFHSISCDHRRHLCVDVKALLNVLKGTDGNCTMTIADDAIRIVYGNDGMS